MKTQKYNTSGHQPEKTENEKIKQAAFAEMIESITDRMFFTRLAQFKIDPVFEADRDHILFTHEQKRNYVVCVPDSVFINGETEEIHGNTRNAIAREFIQKYSNDYFLKIENEKHQKALELEKHNIYKKQKMETIFENEILPLFEQTEIISKNQAFTKKAKFSVYCKTGGRTDPCISFEFRLKNIGKEYSNFFSDKIEIYFDEENTERFSVLTGKNSYYSERENELMFYSVKRKVIELIQRCENAITEYEVLIEQHNKEQEKEKALYNFCYNACNAKEQVTIFRKKNSFISVVNGVRWAIGDGKLGKFMNTSASKVVDLVKKGYTEYYQEQYDRYAKRRTSEQLMSLEWKVI